MRKRNEGFSMVELVIVLALMGVLMVVLAPQYLKYVEHTKLQKDNTAIDEIAENIKMACAQEEIAEWMIQQNAPVEFRFIGGVKETKTIVFSTTSSNLLEKELAGVVDGGYQTVSNTYSISADAVEFVVRNESGVFVVYVNGYIDEADGEAGTRRF
ncbi:MAG: prepilin-type N-terminal cleavage/methylation domain-containing protein [Lachnospiraceae bacterium]|nr:prepilin-type N-terminal cleavage/methylation domain-containing protein [Lachnospiraceae bacterium]